MHHATRSFQLFSLTLLLISTIWSVAQPPSTNVQLRIERRTNAVELQVAGDAPLGAFFIYRADTIEALSASPTVAVQTNTPLTNSVWFSLPASGTLHRQAFFTAAHWPGRAVEEFAEPEDYPDISPPEMLLFADGAPETLTSGQTFMVDFYITDQAAQILDISGPVAILVFRESDGVLHPDASVSPATAQLTNGHTRVSIKVQATTPLIDYVLGFGSALGGEVAFLEDLFAPASSGLNQNVQAAANVSPQTMAQRRTANADAGPSWNYPLAGAGHPVSGTFGEWRGKNNADVHRGVDLVAVAASTVVAARGGVVSHRGTLENMGDYLVVDHGGGWFSRYLHLDGAYISVKFGQAVARGATLATRLYAVGNWPQHLHFEVRQGGDQPQWYVGLPGTGRDPLQEPQIFAVAPGNQPPLLREFGLTRRHPGQHAFIKAPPNTDMVGPVYLFAKFLDLEAGHRLGLRAINFRPEAATTNNWIWPSNDTAIAGLLPSALALDKGFARYDDDHAQARIPSDRRALNYYRYWWRWDTSTFATDRIGARSLLLRGTDRNSFTADFSFIFGPMIKGGTVTHLGSNRFRFITIAHLGNNTPLNHGDPTLFVQPDQYKLEIIGPTGLPLNNIIWAGPMAAADYTRVFDDHLDEAAYTFTLPENVRPVGLKLRVSSRMAPDIADQLDMVDCPPEPFTPDPNLVWIPCGTFIMGSPLNEAERGGSEGPQTRVTISRGFWMGRYEVTQGEYLGLMGTNPSYFNGTNMGWDSSCGCQRLVDYGTDLNRPVDSVDWSSATAYCNALTLRERNAERLPAGYRFRLPTEAEWEYACRAGTTTPFHYGNQLRSGMANFYAYYEYPACGGQFEPPCYGSCCYNPDAVFLFRTTSVGSYAPNAWGLYDMHGNVNEWCSDWWYGQLPGGSVIDPRGPSTGQWHVARGGTWGSQARYCRAAYRGNFSPVESGYYGGFRIVLSPSDQ